MTEVTQRTVNWGCQRRELSPPSFSPLNYRLANARRVQVVDQFEIGKMRGQQKNSPLGIITLTLLAFSTSRLSIDELLVAVCDDGHCLWMPPNRAMKSSSVQT